MPTGMVTAVGERDGGEEEEEERRKEAEKLRLRGLSREEKAAEAVRLRRGIELDRLQILWKEERISILEEGIDASDALQGVGQLVLSGDPAPEPASAFSDSSPVLNDGEAGGVPVCDMEM